MPILIEINQDNLKGFGELNCMVGRCKLGNTNTDLSKCTAYAGSLISFICDNKTVNKALSTPFIRMLQPLFAPVLTYKDQANVQLHSKPSGERIYSDCVETQPSYYTPPLHSEQSEQYYIYYILYYTIYYITQHGICSYNDQMMDISVHRINELDISMRVNIEQGLAVRLTPTFLL